MGFEAHVREVGMHLVVEGEERRVGSGKEQVGEPTEELRRSVTIWEAHGRSKSRDPCLQDMSEAQVTQTLWHSGLSPGSLRLR